MPTMFTGDMKIHFNKKDWEKTDILVASKLFTTSYIFNNHDFGLSRFENFFYSWLHGCSKVTLFHKSFGYA